MVFLRHIRPLLFLRVFSLHPFQGKLCILLFRNHHFGLPPGNCLQPYSSSSHFINESSPAHSVSHSLLPQQGCEGRGMTRWKSLTLRSPREACMAEPCTFASLHGEEILAAGRSFYRWPSLWRSLWFPAWREGEEQGTKEKVPRPPWEGVPVIHPHPCTPRKPPFRKVTSVQHDVVDHVAFVFGVIEAERTAEIFGALLRNRRMPGFHVHSKSRSGREVWGTGNECDRGSCHPHIPCWLSSYGASGCDTPAWGAKVVVVNHVADHRLLGHSSDNWTLSCSGNFFLKVLPLGWVHSLVWKAMDFPIHFSLQD